MIRSFGDLLSFDLFHDRVTKESRRFPRHLRRVAQRKLQYLNAAVQIKDLAQPPGNRLKALKGKLTNYYSIRINDQWRIIFRWDNGAIDVRIEAYH